MTNGRGGSPFDMCYFVWLQSEANARGVSGKGSGENLNVKSEAGKRTKLLHSQKVRRLPVFYKNYPICMEHEKDLVKQQG